MLLQLVTMNTHSEINKVQNLLYKKDYDTFAQDCRTKASAFV